ncbi:MAG: hypothetical protein U1F66_06330 [bacterium]
MEQFSQDQMIQELYQGVVTQLNRTLQTQAAQEAEKELRLAEKIMKKIESRFLANPFASEQELQNVVQFTRGPLWKNAREYLANLQGRDLYAFTA